VAEKTLLSKAQPICRDATAIPDARARPPLDAPAPATSGCLSTSRSRFHQGWNTGSEAVEETRNCETVSAGSTPWTFVRGLWFPVPHLPSFCHWPPPAVVLNIRTGRSRDWHRWQQTVPTVCFAHCLELACLDEAAGPKVGCRCSVRRSETSVSPVTWGCGGVAWACGCCACGPLPLAPEIHITVVARGFRGGSQGVTFFSLLLLWWVATMLETDRTCGAA